MHSPDAVDQASLPTVLQESDRFVFSADAPLLLKSSPESLDIVPPDSMVEIMAVVALPMGVALDVALDAAFKPAFNAAFSTALSAAPSFSFAFPLVQPTVIALQADASPVITQTLVDQLLACLSQSLTLDR